MARQKFSTYEIDQLKEALNIGASHASVALSHLIGKRVMISIPEAVDDGQNNKTASTAGMAAKNESATVVVLKILGDKPGHISFFLFKDAARRLAQLVMKEQRGIDQGAVKMEQSALKEAGDIICSSALAAFSKFLGVALPEAVSIVREGKYGELVNSIKAETGDRTEMALAYKVSFLIEREDIASHLCVFASEKVLIKILAILKTKFKKA